MASPWTAHVIRDWGTMIGLTWALCPPLSPEVGVLCAYAGGRGMGGEKGLRVDSL